MFAGRENLIYRVRIGDAECASPCELLAPPGPTSVRVSGPARFTTRLQIPPQPIGAEVRHRDAGSFITGTILVASGLANVAAAGLVWLPNAFSEPQGFDELLYSLVTIGSGVTAIVLLSIGIPMMVGAGRDAIRLVPLDKLKLPALTLRGVGVHPSASGAIGTLTFSF